MSRVFLIAGLGADKRLYKNVVLSGHEMICTDWLEPAKTDTLTTYAQLLINHYDIKVGDVVIGDSLGGMLAMEISKKLKLRKTVIISSIKTSNEVPGYFKLFRLLPVYNIIPGFLFNSLGFMLKLFFGDMSEDDLRLFKSMLKDSSPKFMKWAIHALLHWKSDAIPENVYHITGDKDMVFSWKRIKGATIINGGTHIMIFDRASEINALLKTIID